MSRRLPAWFAIAAAVMLLSAVAACSEAGDSSGAPAIVVAPIDTPLTEPVWSSRAEALFGLTHAGSAVSKVVPGTGGRWRQSDSPALPDIGRNIAESADTGRLYVPRPHAGDVTVLSETTMRPVGTIRGLAAPSYASTDAGSHHVLLLDTAGATVTPLDIHTDILLPSHRVRTSGGDEIDGADRGRRVDFFLSGPSGISHYQWEFGKIGRDGSLSLPTSSAVSDPTKPSRLYAGVRDRDRVVAVGLGRDGSGLRIIAHAQLDGPVLQLGADDGRIYAATPTSLYVLASNSFEGFEHRRIGLIRRIDLRSALTGSSGSHAIPSGIAVGPDRIFLTVRDEPLIIGIAKPPL